jgi:CRP-like cAMP-binding protein
MMIDKLSELSFFEGLGDVALADIAMICTEVDLYEGELLINENDTENHLYFLCEGRVEITSSQKGSTGGESVLSNDDVEIFGEMSWLCGFPCTANVRAVSKVVAIKVDGPRLMKYLEGNTIVGFALMRRVAQVIAMRLKKSDVLLKQVLWSIGI